MGKYEPNAQRGLVFETAESTTDDSQQPLPCAPNVPEGLRTHAEHPTVRGIVETFGGVVVGIELHPAQPT